MHNSILTLSFTSPKGLVTKTGEHKMELILGLVSGAVGGNVAGGFMKDYNLGVLGNSVAGIVGGGIGSQILGLLSNGGIDAVAAAADGATGGMGVGSIIASVAGGGVGGGALLAIIGVVKNMMAK
jgi:hypothetical protein